MSSEAFQTLCGPGESTVQSSDIQSALAASGISNRNPELSQMIGSVNGAIDAGKFAQLTGTVKSKAYPQGEQKAIFAAFDDAGKGAVDFEAFSASIQALGCVQLSFSYLVLKRVREGGVTGTLLLARFHLPDDEMRCLFEEADVNGDGKITEQDWLATMGKSTLV
eukprot:scaffold1696_cov258-Pinguiococcus_pyrenoidosus.AAC.40